METTTKNDILFDDVAIIENRFGKAYLRADNISKNGDCTNYTGVQEDDFNEEII